MNLFHAKACPTVGGRNRHVRYKIQIIQIEKIATDNILPMT